MFPDNFMTRFLGLAINYVNVSSHYTQPTLSLTFFKLVIRTEKQLINWQV